MVNPKYQIGDEVYIIESNSAGFNCSVKKRITAIRIAEYGIVSYELCNSCNSDSYKRHESGYLVISNSPNSTAEQLIFKCEEIPEKLVKFLDA